MKISMQNRFTRLVPIAVLVAIVVLFISAPVYASSVTPVVISGNPVCPPGYFDFKIDQSLIVQGQDVYTDGSLVVTITRTGEEIDWFANFGVDIVFVKGSNQANRYSYSPEAFSDNDLVAPVNASGEPAGISHVNFCYDIELIVEKTANTYWKNTTTWTIDKQVTPASADRLIGESATFDYTLVIDRTDVASDWKIYGEVTIINPSNVAVGYTVSDVIGNAQVAVTLNCDVNPIPAKGTATCTYAIFPGSQAYAGENNVAIVTSTTVGVGGGQASAQVNWGAAEQVGPTSVDVTDTPDDLQFDPLSQSGVVGDTSIPYKQTYTCSTDTSLYDPVTGKYSDTINNTAEIKDGDTVIDDDSETVTVNCYRPFVSKTADASFDRDWTWTVDKTADATELTLSVGETYVVNYTVKFTSSSADSNHAISGKISVVNPSPLAMNVSVADVLNDGTPVVIDCGDGAGDVTLAVAANSSADCDYTAAPDSDSATLNTATATLNGIAFNATADVNFDITETDECVDVSDTFDGSTVTGTLCGEGDSFEQTFTYTRELRYDVCGEYTVENTAAFVTNDTDTPGSNDHTIVVDVPCGGCTLTIGYWKTHNSYRAAPDDAGWFNIGNLGPDTPFFISGRTWYQIFWTSPAGNRYYNLAHQYMGAKLNILNGAAPTPAVTAAIAYAESLFNSKTIAQVGALKGKDLTALNTNQGILAAFNEGAIGPGHCDEDSSSAHN
jgi:hypothetical protein